MDSMWGNPCLFIIKTCVFRDWVFKTQNILSFHTVWANNGHSAQTKTAPEGAAIDYLLYSYDLLRLATPIKPIRLTVWLLLF